MDNTIISVSSPYAPELILQARRTFFDEGVVSAGLVDDPLLRSWQRCRSLGRRAADRIEFDPVDRAALGRLLESNLALLESARPELDALVRSVSGAGFGVLLTDARGRALASYVDGHCEALRPAFRPGVDLSESIIGTSAMTLAITEQQAVGVRGVEHFCEDNHAFHCYAAPLFDPHGRLVGAIDVSRDTPGSLSSALTLTQRCAWRIERKLFEALPAFVWVSLESPVPSDGAMLAFDHDGGLVASNLAARNMLDLASVPQGVGFHDLFDSRFDALASAARKQNGVLELLLRGGVRLRAQATIPLVAARTTVSAKSATAPLRVADSARSASRPAFGDAPFSADFERALRAFNNGLPLLVTGETGVGKEVAVRALHGASNRHGGPLVVINCGAIAPQLMPAELFGHVDGAFTGARRGGSAGKIEVAEGGTLLLDEIGDMPLDLQVGLLRVLERGEVVRVGATREMRVDVRFVCATHFDLRALVAAGRFREDLYYRMCGFVLQVPPLRARSDFDAVLDALLSEAGYAPQRLSAELRGILKAMPWPGNVRQLRHALRLALALVDSDEPLGLHHFPADEPGFALPSGASRVEANSREFSWKQAQRQSIDDALQRTGGNVTAAAALLGMGRATLYRKLMK